jgi:hypothetical protein
MRRLLLLLSMLLFGVSAWGQNYTSYTGPAVVQWPTVPNMGGPTKNGALWTDPSYPSGTPGTVARCTDQALTASTAPNQSKGAGLGGSGDAAQMFEVNATLLHFSSSGGIGFLTLFNPLTMVCGDPVTGHAITADKNLSNPGSATTAYNFGNSGSFDWLVPGTWYAAFSGSDVTDGLSIVPYTINTSTGTFTVGSAVTSFKYGLPLGSLVSAWQASTAYAKGVYVSYTLTSGQAPDWAATTAYSTLGTLIRPLTGNPQGCAFKLTQAGTSGSTHPAWNTTVCPPASNGQITDGAAGWRSIGGGGTFTYQLTSANCTSGSSTPAFVPVATGRPDLMLQVTDNTCTWTNVGPEAVPSWNSFGGVSRNGTRFCSAFASDEYGFNNTYSTFDADQGQGIYASCYDSSLNEFVLMNTATGIQSVTQCVGGTGASCAGGTETLVPQIATTLWAGNCGTFIHNLKGSSTLDHPVIAQQAASGNIPLTPGCATPPVNALYDWEPFATPNASATLQLYPAPGNHWAIGATHLVAVGQQSTGPPNDFTNGIYDHLYNTANLSLAGLATWQPICTTSWTPFNALPDCNFGVNLDSHLSWAWNPGDADSAPVCGTVFNESASIATGSALINHAYQGEEMCVSTLPTWANPGTSGQGTQWRFTHTLNTMTNSDFDTQFSISQLSQITASGQQFLAFGSDWDCTLGDTSGNSTSLCGLPWQSGFVYALNTLVSPVNGLSGGGTLYDVFKVTTAGTSGTSFPGFSTPSLAWASCTGIPSCTVTDSTGVVYTRQGASTGKGEVFVMSLPLVAPAAPTPWAEFLCTTDSIAIPNINDNLREGSHTVTLNWTATSNTLWYSVFRGTANGGPYTLLAACVAGTSYVDVVAPSETLYYVVQAVNGGGASPNSNQPTAPIPVFDTMTGAEIDNTSVQIGETLSTSDTLTPVSSQVIALGETLATSDALTPVSSQVIAMTETLSTSDTLTPISSQVIALSETLATSDAFTAQHGRFATLSETLTTSDSFAGQQHGRLANLSETLTTSDAITPTGTFVATMTEALNTSDSLSSNFQKTVSFGESLTTLDSLNVSFTRITPLAETLTTSDALVPTSLQTAAIAETLSTTDTLIPISSQLAALGETLTTSDSPTWQHGRFPTLGETLSTSDALAATLTAHNASLAENLATSDSFAFTGTFNYPLGENLLTLDALTLTVSVPGTVSNGTAIYFFAAYGIAPAGACGFTLQITGRGFNSNSVVTWNGSVRPTTYISPKVLQVALGNGDMNAPGGYPVIVEQGSYSSQPKYFEVVSAIPTAEAARLSGGALIVDGKNFVPGYGMPPGIVSGGTTVFWNGQPLTTAWISPTRLQAQIPPKAFAIGPTVITVSDVGCFTN